jgi:hypothetical protein
MLPNELFPLGTGAAIFQLLQLDAGGDKFIITLFIILVPGLMIALAACDKRLDTFATRYIIHHACSASPDRAS